MSKWRKKICVFCLGPAESADHVPPKSWFAPPLPPNLITVPACEECNTGWEADAEWLRAILVAGVNLRGHEQADAVLDVVRGSFQRPGTAGLAKAIDGAIVELDLRHPDGQVAGPGVGIRFETRRAAFVLMKMIRGLHYREMRELLPGSAVITTALDQFGTAAGRVLLRFFGASPIPTRSVGRVLSYWMLPAGQEWLWIGCLYENVWFIGHVVFEPSVASRLRPW
jgi:hypothetical protein